MSRYDELYTFDCVLGKETEKAIHVEPLDGEAIWIPLSQVHSMSRTTHGDTITVTQWFAKQKGLI